VTILAGTAAGFAACALSLQASGVWDPTETQDATLVAVAALTASVVTAQGAVDRYQSDMRWRRWRRLTVSVVIALGSAGATAALALVASQTLMLGPAGRGILIGVAAATALAGAVFDAYSDEQAFSEKGRQKQLERATARLLADGFEQIDIAPDDLEVVLFLKARNIFHPKHAALRVVHTVCLGAPHAHPRVIHDGPAVSEADGRSPIWKCYHDAEPVEPMAEIVESPRGKPGGLQLKLRSDTALNTWAAPVRNGKSEVVGVLAVQAYATVSARKPDDIVYLPGVGFTAVTLGGLISSDY
jgi:hypothetical protein